MRLRTKIAGLCSLAAVAAAAPLFAQTSTAPAPPPPPAGVDTEIKGALGRMANALKAMQSFELRAEMTTEDVLDTGQKLQSSGVMTALVRRPNKLQINLDSERKARQFYYDGKQVTIYGPVTGYYATVDAPATTREMLTRVSDRYGLETPLADLMAWGESAVDTDKITSAMYAGADRIGGNVCDHYAFRQPGTDWQLWIRKADPALPCKLVIVNTDDPAQPQTTSTFTWTPRQLTDQQFTFTPAANAKRIELGRNVAAANGGAQ